VPRYFFHNRLPQVVTSASSGPVVGSRRQGSGRMGSVNRGARRHGTCSPATTICSSGTMTIAPPSKISLANSRKNGFA